eukprot:17227_1
MHMIINLLILLIILGDVMDIIFNSCISCEETQENLQIPREYARALTTYSQQIMNSSELYFENTNSPTQLLHIIDQKILTKSQIENIISMYPNATILNDSLQTVYDQISTAIDSNNDVTIQDIRDQTDANDIKKYFKVTKPAANAIFNWIQNKEFPSDVDQNAAKQLLKDMISSSNGKISVTVITRKWIKDSNIKFFGYYFANIYDTDIRKWHAESRKRKKKPAIVIENKSPDVCEENINVVSEQVSVHVSKEQYMQEFDANKNGPLHEQPWVINELESYDKAKSKLTLVQCHKCNNGKMTSARLSMDLWWCDKCWTERKQLLKNNVDINSHIFLYSAENKMDPGIQPEWARDVTPIEEMMCAAAIPFISIYTHRGSGQRKCSGSHINIKQDIYEFAKKLPRHIADIPYIWVNRQGAEQTGNLQDKIFKVRPNKILGLLRGLKENEVPHYTDIEIDYEYIEQLNEGTPADINNIEIVEIPKPKNNKPSNNSPAKSVISNNSISIISNTSPTKSIISNTSIANISSISKCSDDDNDVVIDMPFNPTTDDGHVSENGDEDEKLMLQPETAGNMSIDNDNILLFLGDDEEIEQIVNDATENSKENTNSHTEDEPEPDYHCYMSIPVDGQTENNKIMSALGLGCKQKPVQGPALLEPLNEFTTQFMMTACFPTLFCWGLGDPTSRERARGVDVMMGVRHLIHYAEKRNDSFYFRFASHPTFIFWCHNMFRRHSGLKQTNFVCNGDPTVQYMSIQDMQTSLNNGSNDVNNLLKKIQTYSANVTGSPPYWYKNQQKAKAAFTQLVGPTWFWTYSLADYYDYDLHRILGSAGADYAVRQKVANDNPHIVAEYLEKKMALIQKHFHRNILNEKWNIHRREWQGRGTGHGHGAGELENDPGIQSLCMMTYAGRKADEKIEATMLCLNIIDNILDSVVDVNQNVMNVSIISTVSNKSGNMSVSTEPIELSQDYTMNISYGSQSNNAFNMSHSSQSIQDVDLLSNADIIIILLMVAII